METHTYFFVSNLLYIYIFIVLQLWPKYLFFVTLLVWLNCQLLEWVSILRGIYYRAYDFLSFRFCRVCISRTIHIWDVLQDVWARGSPLLPVLVQYIRLRGNVSFFLSENLSHFYYLQSQFFVHLQKSQRWFNLCITTKDVF